MVVTYHYKKRFDIKPVDRNMEERFYKFDNFYSDAFESQNEATKRNEYN